MIPVYLIEGCGKTYARINDTMPHTCNVWDIEREYINVLIHIQEMSAVRWSSCIENFHIFLEGLRKHFLYVCYLSNSITKLRKFYKTNNTP
jgi:hypothetical protein